MVLSDKSLIVFDFIIIIFLTHLFRGDNMP
jgi:hypothetical protein